MRIKIGDLVKVDHKYQMAEQAPYSGRGTYVADEWTGRVFRVVAISPPSTYISISMASLADAKVIGADESDEIVSIAVGRLTKM